LSFLTTFITRNSKKNMPKIKDTSLRMSVDLRVRMSYQLMDKLKAMAKDRKVSVSEVVRQILKAETDKPF